MTQRHDSTAEPPPEAGEPAVPLEFAAFCELHRPRYLSYARVWLPDPDRAAGAVQQAFAEIAVQWRELLGSSNPTAHAWQILRDTVGDHTRQSGPLSGPVDERAHPGGQQRPGAQDRPGRPADDDLAILHYVVGLAAPEIADVIGTDTASVAGRLRRTMLREASGW
ncbi:RNA polymerase sigma factor [Kitasatospora sp. NPDC015120]|uniref:RNA polymerase sigma factor n=1 Tax=Kitasatospora sp. NPDC015120 TaxID=3364023 RepID=UPI0036F47CD6